MRISKAAFHSEENFYASIGSFQQDLFIPIYFSNKVQIKKVPISSFGSLSWMTNEVINDLYFNLTIYTGSIIT